jgi:hypothetical protein
MGLAETQAFPCCTILLQTDTSLLGASFDGVEGFQETQMGAMTPAPPVPAKDVGPLPVHEGDVILADCHKDGGDATTGTQGWLAPVYMNGVLMMFAIDTAITTIIPSTWQLEPRCWY